MPGKRCRGVGAGRLPAEAATRPGPQTFEELFGWPERALDVVEKDASFMANFECHVQQGVSLRTMYSGIDTPAAMLSYIQDAARRRGWKIGKGIRTCHSADSDAECQRVIASFDDDNHVFGKFEDRFPPRDAGHDRRLHHRLRSLEMLIVFEAGQLD